MSHTPHRLGRILTAGLITAGLVGSSITPADATNHTSTSRVTDNIGLTGDATANDSPTNLPDTPASSDAATSEPVRVVAIPAVGVERSTIARQIDGVAHAQLEPATGLTKTVADKVIEVTINDPTHVETVITQMQASSLYRSVGLDETTFAPAAYTSNPNDPYYADAGSWGLKAWPGSRFNQTWATLGNAPGNANSAPIAILDVGFYTNHEDAGPNWTPVWDYGMGRDDVRPYSVNDGDHGNEVAGVVGAATNNGKGVAGAAWDNKLLLYKVTDADGAYPDSAIAKAFYDAIAKGARVINMSFGGRGFGMLEPVIADANAAGVTVVAAAGNTGANVVEYPAAYPGVISVAGSTQAGGAASWSTWNSQVDIAAPGDSVIGMSLPGPPTLYFRGSGTSLASPLVCAAVALMLRWRPELRPDLVEKILKETAQAPTGGLTDSLRVGAGVLDAAGAVERAKWVPVIRAGSSAGVTEVTIPAGGLVSVPVRVTGSPTPSVWADQLPPGVSLVDQGGGRFVLTGRPTVAGDWSVGLWAVGGGGVDTVRVPVRVTPAAASRVVVEPQWVEKWADETVQVAVEAFDQYGNQIATTDGDVVWPAGLVGCRFPAGQGLSWRRCPVSAKVGDVTADPVVVDVFDRTVFNTPVIAPHPQAGVTSQVVDGLDWPGLTYTWQVNGGGVDTGLSYGYGFWQVGWLTSVQAWFRHGRLEAEAESPVVEILPETQLTPTPPSSQPSSPSPTPVPSTVPSSPDPTTPVSATGPEPVVTAPVPASSPDQAVSGLVLSGPVGPVSPLPGQVLELPSVPAGWTVAGVIWLVDGIPVDVAGSSSRLRLTASMAGSRVSVRLVLTRLGQPTQVLVSRSVGVTKLKPTLTVKRLKSGKVRVKVKAKGLSGLSGRVKVRFGKVTKTYQLRAKHHGKRTVTIPVLAFRKAKGKPFKVKVTWSGSKQTRRVAKTLPKPIRTS